MIGVSSRNLSSLANSDFGRVGCFQLNVLPFNNPYIHYVRFPLLPGQWSYLKYFVNDIICQFCMAPSDSLQLESVSVLVSKTAIAVER